MPARKNSKTTRRASRPVSQSENVDSYEERLSPEAIRKLNESLGKPSRPPYLLILLVVALTLFSGYLFMQVQTLKKQAAAPGAGQQAGNQVAPTRPTSLKVTKPNSQDHWRGNTNARYVWVEYSDLECPFCKRIHPDLVKLTSENPDIAWVFRHYPLPFHPKAQKSAEAVECAQELGGTEAFWKMNDAIFEKMPDLELTQLSDVASEIGLDSAAFQQCVDSGKFANKVKSEQEEGTKAGVQATPTGVIYDMKTGKTKLVEGALPYESLKQELQSFIAQNK